MSITKNKKLLEDYKLSHIDPCVFIGKLYSLNSDHVFNNLSANNNVRVTLPKHSTVMITNIIVADTVTYFNIGPAIIISVLHNMNTYHLFIFPKQIIPKLLTASQINKSHGAIIVEPNLISGSNNSTTTTISSSVDQLDILKNLFVPVI